jgi:hypothetical protein
MEPDARVVPVVLRTITPLFPGEEGLTEGRLRPSVFREAVRFWWRLVSTGRDGAGPEEWAAREERLFGSRADGRGLVTFRLDASRVRIMRPEDLTPAYKEWTFDASLLAHGFVSERMLPPFEVEVRRIAKKPVRVFEPSREFVDARETISFDLVFDPAVTSEERRDVFAALWLWTHFGGTGAHARRGWGSMRLEAPGTIEPPVVEAARREPLEEALRSGVRRVRIGPESGGGPGLETSGGQAPKILCPNVSGTWLAAMDWIGARIREFRETGGVLRKSEAEEARAKLAALFRDTSAGEPSDAPSAKPGEEAKLKIRDPLAMPLTIHFHPMMHGEIATVVSAFPPPAGTEEEGAAPAVERFFAWLRSAMRPGPG